MSERPYPDDLAVYGPSRITLDCVKSYGARDVAEIGVYKGHTSVELAKILPAGGSLHLFDFADVLEEVVPKAKEHHSRVFAYPTTHKVKDSYCWQLGKLLERSSVPLWDYIYLDGAHTWEIDALAVLLSGRLLRSGGHIELDDYHWTMERSAAVGPFASARDWYTAEQMRTPAVKMICDTLLRPDPAWTEVVPCRVFRKG